MLSLLNARAVPASYNSHWIVLVTNDNDSTHLLDNMILSWILVVLPAECERKSIMIILPKRYIVYSRHSALFVPSSRCIDVEHVLHL